MAGAPPSAYIGLMSGTSMDGIDAVLVNFNNGQAELLQRQSIAYPDNVRNRLERVSQNEGTPDDLGELDHILGKLFGRAALEVIRSSPLSASDVAAIGSHGQTIRHKPEGQSPFTLQIGDPNLIAEMTGVTTVGDFRRRDMAAGGQGAPLVPAFHQAMFGDDSENRCIINIGGIANISWLPADKRQSTTGFDTGPGNALMDAWCLNQTGRHFDEDGHWAAEGRTDQALLSDMLTDAYFGQPAPKSTGKEKFNLAWIQTILHRHPDVLPSDVQRTLLELTVITIVRQLPSASGQRIFICGGGAKNPLLMKTLSLACNPMPVHATSELGVDPQWVEATAFAWLARQTLARQSGNLPAVTGAHGARILGAVYWP